MPKNIVPIISLTFAITVLAILFSGCGAIRTYDGSPLPKSQVAVLHISKPLFWTVGAAIDPDQHFHPNTGFYRPGMDDWYYSPDANHFVDNLELLPGHHVIRFKAWEQGGYTDPVDKAIDVEAGKRYEAMATIAKTTVTLDGQRTMTFRLDISINEKN